MKRYYVTVIRDGKTGWLAGPFFTHDDALRMVQPAREEAYNVDHWTSFDAFGTASIERKDLNFPIGKLNSRLGIK